MSQLQSYAERIGKPERDALIHAIQVGQTYEGIAREVGWRYPNSVRAALVKHKLSIKQTRGVIIEETA